MCVVDLRRRSSIIVRRGLFLLLLLIVVQGLLVSCKQAREKSDENACVNQKKSALVYSVCIAIKDSMERLYAPILETTNQTENLLREGADRQLFWLLPTYEYAVEHVRREQKEVFLRQILWEEAQEAVGETTGQVAEIQKPDVPISVEAIEVPAETVTKPVISNGTADRTVSDFQPHEKQLELNPETFFDFDSLLSSFYIVDPTTQANEKLMNATNFLAKDMTIEKDTLGPQILIYHTHSQEAFADSVPGDPTTTIVGAGDRLKDLLENTYGFQVLHHTESYDLPNRNKAYSNAKPSIEKLLQENPSIQVVIDLHRDSMPEDKKQVVQIDGRSTAKFMFFNGLSYHRKTGEISYLKNDNLENNLAFSFQMQKAANEYYPGATRKIYLKGYRYNMHLMDKYLLIELGAQNNTVEEAMNACDVIAHLLYLVLSGEA